MKIKLQVFRHAHHQFTQAKDENNSSDVDHPFHRIFAMIPARERSDSYDTLTEYPAQIIHSGVQSLD